MHTHISAKQDDSNLIIVKNLFKSLKLKENDLSSQHYVFIFHDSNHDLCFWKDRWWISACMQYYYFFQMGPCQCQLIVSLKYVFCSFRSITLYLLVLYEKHQLNGIYVVYCCLFLISNKNLVSTAECYTLILVMGCISCIHQLKWSILKICFGLAVIYGLELIRIIEKYLLISCVLRLLK